MRTKDLQQLARTRDYLESLLLMLAEDEKEAKTKHDEATKRAGEMKRPSAKALIAREDTRAELERVEYAKEKAYDAFHAISHLLKHGENMAEWKNGTRRTR